jgi:hypothetical protein
MIKKMHLILLVVVVAVVVIGAAVYIYSSQPKEVNDEPNDSFKVTFTTIESGFKLTYNDKDVRAGTPFFVQKGTGEITLKVYTPNGGYQIKYWPATDSDGTITITEPEGAAGTWFSAKMYFFGECDFVATLTSYGS